MCRWLVTAWPHIPVLSANPALAAAGVMDRVVSQLLAEIDGIQSSNTDVFIFGATNRPDLVDPALVRPGRLDALVYVGLPSGPAAREKILKALTRKFDLDHGVEFATIAEECSDLFSGADLYALCADAWMIAMRSLSITMGTASGGDQVRSSSSNKVVVQQEHFRRALSKLKPSLTKEQLRYYENDHNSHTNRSVFSN